MARFSGIPPITGTIGPVCIYQMHGRYFMRTRSSLTGERVKKDPAFRKTMAYASLLAKASRIGSTVYAALPADKKQHSVYRKLTGEAMYWLKYKWPVEDVLDLLLKLYAGQQVPEEAQSAGEDPVTIKQQLPFCNIRRSIRKHQVSTKSSVLLHMGMFRSSAADDG